MGFTLLNTNVNNITRATLYTTGNSTNFDTSYLLSSTTNFSNNRVIFSGVNDTSSRISSNTIHDTVYYWLGVDISPTANLNDSITAILDSATITNKLLIPDITIPSWVKIRNENTYINSSYISATRVNLHPGSAQNLLGSFKINMSSTGVPVTKLSKIYVKLVGNKGNSFRVFYTGGVNNFSNQRYLSGDTNVKISNTVIDNINQPLNNGDNYFWVTTDMVGSNASGDSMLVQLDSFVLNNLKVNTTQLVSQNSLSYSNVIGAAYCTPAYKPVGNILDSVQINNQKGTREVVEYTNDTTSYWKYTSTNFVKVNQGGKIPISLYGVSSNLQKIINAGNTLAVRFIIDWNNNGVLESTEQYDRLWNINDSFRIEIPVPCYAKLGRSRMRLLIVDNYIVTVNEIFRIAYTTSAAQTCDTSKQFKGYIADYTLDIENQQEDPGILNIIRTQVGYDTGTYIYGSTDIPTIRLKTITKGCNTDILRELRIISKNGGEINNKIGVFNVYANSKDSFDKVKLIKTYKNPVFVGNQYTFSNINDSLNSVIGYDSAIRYYWIRLNAAKQYVAAIDSIKLGLDSLVGNVGTMVQHDSTIKKNGLIKLLPPTIYLGSRSMQYDTNFLLRGTNDNTIVGFQIENSATGAPIPLTNIYLKTMGSTNIGVDVSKLKVYYTGNNPVFSTGVVYGDSSTNNIKTGQVYLNAGINYFWISANIASTATIGNKVLLGIDSFKLYDTVYVPVKTGIIGGKRITYNYCKNSGLKNGGNYITRLRVSNLVNNKDTTQLLAMFDSVGYNDYSGLTPVVLKQGSIYTLNLQTTRYSGLDTNQLSVYIDWNNNGVFAESNELVYRSSKALTAGLFYSIKINVPCNSSVGLSRMRIVYGRDTAIQGCVSSRGEGSSMTDDYTVDILTNPFVFVSSQAVQQGGNYYPGTNNVPIFQIPVVVTGCGIAKTDSLLLSGYGSTNLNNDVSVVKLYKTGNSNIFNPFKLLDTAVIKSNDPSYLINFNKIKDTLSNIANGGTSDTTYYWLTYNIKPSAALGNVLDAIYLNYYWGGNRVQVNDAPEGVVSIGNKARFISSIVEQADTLSNIFVGSLNNILERVKVVISDTGAPLNLYSLYVNTHGTTDTINIRDIKAWFTGASSSFNNSYPLGFVQTNRGKGLYRLSGSQLLQNGVNYIWITASINNTVANGNRLAIGIDSVLLDTIKQGVLFNAVSRKIQDNYCTPAGIPANSGYISGVQIGATINTSDCASTAPGANSIPILYGNYTQLVEPIRLGEILNIQLNTGFCNGVMANYRPVVYIDWNQNGVFETVDSVYISDNTSSTNYTIQIPIPCYANLGKTRIRIIYGLQTEAINKGCLSSNNNLKYASVQDYSLWIMPSTNQNTRIVSTQIVSKVNPYIKNALLYQLGVKNGGCPLVKIDSLYFNTIGSSNFKQDIDSIKLYKTGTSNEFRHAVLLASKKVDNHQLWFTGLNDTIKNIGAGNYIDTNYYWVSIDMSRNAVVGDTVNMGLDSMYISGNLNVYNKKDTVGKVIIGSFNIGAVQSQLDNNPISLNQTDYPVVRIEITDTTGYNSQVTKVYVSKKGSNPLKSIGNATLWYTGTSNQFAKTGQFGVQDTTTVNENIVFSGNQQLVKGTNYFWITYSVVSGLAKIGDTLRIRGDSVKINDTNVRIHALNAGDYKIVRQGYPTINKDSNNGGYISKLVLNQQGLIIDSNQYKTSTKVYVDSTNAVQRLGVLQQGVLYNVAVNTGNYRSTYNRLLVYVDWNNNGLFNNAGEQISISKPVQGDQQVVIPIKVPCTSNLGSLRMRLLFVDSINTQDSTNYGADFKRGGVVLDATVEVAAQMQQLSIQNIPQAGGYLAKTRNVPIVSIPVVLRGCGVATLDTLLLNVKGSYDTNDLLNVKVYKTSNRAVFDTNQLIGSLVRPFNSKTIKLGLNKKDTVQNFANNNSSDTNYYWIASDISGGATIGDTLRIKADSVYVLNGYKGSTINEADTVRYPVIQKPLHFIGFTNTYIDTNSIAQNSKNNILLKTAVEMGIGESIQLTKIYIDSIGTNKLSDIDTIKLWYTGLNNAFQTPQLFGKIIKPAKNNLTITGNILLQTGINYIWTTADISPNAVIGNHVGLGIDSIRVFDTNYKAIISNPLGIKRIRGAYCTNTGVDNSNNYIQQIGFKQTNYVLDTMAHSSYINNINNSRIGVQKATQDTLRIKAGIYDTAKNNVLLVYIDWNNDGDLSDNGELVYQSKVDTVLSKTYLVPVSVPCAAVNGNTLLRIIYTQQPVNATDSNNILNGFCLNKSVTADFNIEITDNPIQVIRVQDIRNTGLYDKADTNVPVLKIPIVVQGCGVLGLRAIQVNTIGTSHIEDISKIRIYSSGNKNSFSQSSKLLASKTITNETGSLITLNGFYDTLQSYYTGKVSDTNYYWVNYDILNSSVVYGDTLNGNVDSIQIGDSIYRNPTPIDSIGKIYIRLPKEVLSIASINPDTKSVLAGSSNNVVMKVKVEVGAGSAVPLTNMFVNLRGTDSLWAVDSIKVWFTGNKDSFYA
ncbi:MAG: GEVED domain-containing protein, partial [Sediminibacterium sp.]|nr:GEVED domain-containing protein [Sediminibacterium sp.]